MSIDIKQEVTELKEELIAVRRDFHMHPELAFEEYRTAEILATRLEKLGFEVQTGVAKTGVVGVLNLGTPGKTLMLRADIDALPIQETGKVDYISQNDGVMHACGHDGHTAMLLGAAKVLADNKDKIKGTVRFLFQPAEEGAGGARYMIEDGCLEGVDEAYGTAGTSSADTRDTVGASVDYAVASGVTATIGYSDIDDANEGTNSTNTSGSAWYVGATVSF